MEKKITLPITDEDIKNLKAGDSVLLTVQSSQAEMLHTKDFMN